MTSSFRWLTPRYQHFFQLQLKKTKINCCYLTRWKCFFYCWHCEYNPSITAWPVTKNQWCLTMTPAMSSGLSPSRSNLKVTILSLWVCSWHSTTRSTLSESCRDGQDQCNWQVSVYSPNHWAKLNTRGTICFLCVSKHVNMCVYCKTQCV